jgi:hypothetical protein
LFYFLPIVFRPTRPVLPASKHLVLLCDNIPECKRFQLLFLHIEGAPSFRTSLGCSIEILPKRLLLNLVNNPSPPQVPNQDKEVKIDLSGSCWDQALFLTGADAPDAAQQLPGDHNTENGALPKTLTVTLVNDGATGVMSKTVTVGCVEGGRAGGKSVSGEFAVEGLEKGSVNAAQGWSVDVGKGSLAPGEKKDVTFSYLAPTKGGEKGAAQVALGEMVEAKVLLQWKGGSPPPKEPQVLLTLKCTPTD